MEQGSVHLGFILMGLLGGLALFLYGMDLMTSSLKRVAGKRMKQWLTRLTQNRFTGVAAGALTTAVIQSSSVTTVLTVGFVAAGLMKLQQAISIILGAEIGTTVTAQIIAFKVTQYALIFVATGFAINFLSQDDRRKRIGILILGFGLVFFGMALMGEATRPLRDYAPFVALLQQMQNPLFGVLVSAAFTALIQSSSATTGVIIVLASQGLITLEQGISLVFGANIGTSITAVLASIGKPRDARRTALIHVTFNVLGVTLWIGFLQPFAEAVRLISPSITDMDGMARLAAETPRQIANAHTLFNVGNTLIFIGFTAYLARIVTWIIPVTEEEKAERVAPKYLDPVLLKTPSLAFDRIRMEIGRLAARVLPMVSKGPEAVMTGSTQELRALARMDRHVDTLHDAIVDYIRKLSKKSLDSQETELAHAYLAIAGHYESIGDTLKTDLVHLGIERLRHDIKVSDETQELIRGLSKQIFEVVEDSVQAVTRWDREIAASVIETKAELEHSIERLESHILRRITADEPHRRVTYRMESEMLENLRRVYYFARKIAKVVLNQEPLPDYQHPVEARETAQKADA